MRNERWRRMAAWLGGVAAAISISSCTGEPPGAGEAVQEIGTPPTSSNEAVFPYEYSDIVIGRGIRTVTGSRTAGSCVQLPENARYEASGVDWSSEGMAIANQAEFARKFNLDGNTAITHGDASVNLGLKALRELDWKSASLKLVIRVVYTYNVVMLAPDAAELTQAAYDLIAPPAANDTEALRNARARTFLQRCGRYWVRGARKGAELLIVYSLNNVRSNQVTNLGATVSGSVPARVAVGGEVKADQQAAFKNAIQGASLKVYARGFKINAGDPLVPISQAMDPAGNNNTHLASLAGFFNDIKASVNRSLELDSAPMANPIASNTDARKIAMIGHYYQPLFRTPRAGAGSTLASWAGQAQTDLLTQDNALYNTISQYTTFLTAARAAERTANYVRGTAANGQWNFPSQPEYTIAGVQARTDRVRDTVRVVENATGPLPRNVNGGLNTDAQETAFWARRCWDLVVNGNESEPCFAVTEFYNRAQTALTAFRNDLPKPLNFFSVLYVLVTFTEFGPPRKTESIWTFAESYCQSGMNSRLMPLNLKLPSSEELNAFGPFLSGSPSHAPGLPGMDFKNKFLWESTRWTAWEWTRDSWIGHTFSGRFAGRPDHPFVCIRPDGPYAMPFIMF